MTKLPLLTAAAGRAPAAAEAARLKDLKRFSEGDVAALQGMGPTAMASLAKALKAPKPSSGKK